MATTTTPQQQQAAPGTTTQAGPAEDDEEEDEGADEAGFTMPEVVILGSSPNAANHLRDIGDEAVWSLSTAKPGNGVEELRDNNLETYWQSDGGQPHLINLQFHRKMSISEIAFYLDYSLDESYTPKKVSVRSGTTFHDLVEVRSVDLNEPTGWVVVPLVAPKRNAYNALTRTDDDDSIVTDDRILRCFFLQVCVVSMHQNGRDTHVRQARIFGPRTPVDAAVDLTGLGFRPGGYLSRFAVLR